MVSEIASGSGGKVKINDTCLNNLIGDTEDELVGKLELGSTMLDITKGLKIVKQRKDDAKCLCKYTILMYITRSAWNTASQFSEIESELSKGEIIEVLLKHLKYELADGSRIYKRKKNKYFGKGDGFYWLNLSEDHAYIYVGDSDGKRYKNNFTDVIDFIYRNNPENKPSVCSIM